MTGYKLRVSDTKPLRLQHIGARKQVDGHKWMKALRLPYYTVAILREMKLGEHYYVGYFEGPGVTNPGYCYAWFERVRGGYDHQCHFSLTITAKHHTHIYQLDPARFRLLNNSIIEFHLGAEDPIRSFEKVCRYIAHFTKNSGHYGVPNYRFINGRHALWRCTKVLGNGKTHSGELGPDSVVYVSPDSEEILACGSIEQLNRPAGVVDCFAVARKKRVGRLSRRSGKEAK
jgi:hypothetical protein